MANRPIAEVTARMAMCFDMEIRPSSLTGIARSPRIYAMFTMERHRIPKRGEDAVPKRGDGGKESGASDAPGQQLGKRFYSGRVSRVEAGLGGAVEVNHRDHRTFADYRHNQFGLAGFIASDMAREGVDIGH